MQIPSKLKKISHPPKKLFFKGSYSKKLFENCLAVVGSRRITNYGRVVTKKLVEPVAAAGITIVSGFMYGVDTIAHKTALSAGGKTVAVLAWGIDTQPPDYNANLQKEIINGGGMLLSEFEGNYPSSLWMFPKRNRIVAGLCQATLVVEAGIKSGSLITANFAKRYAREVFAVPGPITSVQSAGTNKLISEGAKIVTSADDILEFFNIPKLPFPQWKKKNKDPILVFIEEEPADLDTLVRKTGIPAGKLGVKLTELILAGVVNEERGKYYAS